MTGSQKNIIYPASIYTHCVTEKPNIHRYLKSHIQVALAMDVTLDKFPGKLFTRIDFLSEVPIYSWVKRSIYVPGKILII